MIDVTSLGPFIGNRTVPPLVVQVEPISVNTVRVARITVPKARQIVATSDGVLKRRRLDPNQALLGERGDGGGGAGKAAGRARYAVSCAFG